MPECRSFFTAPQSNERRITELCRVFRFALLCAGRLRNDFRSSLHGFSYFLGRIILTCLCSCYSTVVISPFIGRLAPVVAQRTVVDPDRLRLRKEAAVLEGGGIGLLGPVRAGRGLGDVVGGLGGLGFLLVAAGAGAAASRGRGGSL